MLKTKLLCATSLLLASGISGAALVSASNYGLASINGPFAWGNTDANAFVTLGSVNNATDLGTVEALLSDGYAFSAAGSSTINGIYNWPTGGVNELTFTLTGNYTLNSLSFISSRNYSQTTSIAVDVLLDGGPWTNVVTTTSGALGIVTGAAGTYTLNLGGVSADAFRFRVVGEQLSLHEISIDGAALTATVPEPASIALVGLALFGLGAARRRRLAD